MKFSRIIRLFFPLIILGIVATGISSCNDDDDDSSSNGWEGVQIGQASAPDQYSVVLELTENPGDSSAKQASAYSITSNAGDLDISDISYNADKKKVTLETEKQKLGITYTVSIESGATAEFLAANTAQFWTYDFSKSNFPQYRITARRAGVGKQCVIYIEEEMSASDTNHTISQFDNRIYPVETKLYAMPGDIDGNGKIVILGLDGGNYFGGYFSAVNTYRDEDTMNWWGSHSNETEMVYINVVHGSLNPESVISHEFSHLLYNEAHGAGYEYWEYHDEGLAECSVHAVYGRNSNAVSYYTWDPNRRIGSGLSLVHWNWGMYENYVQAYLFWTYIASRLGGTAGYTELFNLNTGSPEEVNDFIAQRLNSNFSTVHHQNLIANWIQSPQGPYGFNGMLSFSKHNAPTVPSGTSSVNLEPFAGAFFPLTEDSVAYPGTQGPHIMYAGISPEDSVDLKEPFDVNGGVLLTYNNNFQYAGWTKEHSGPDIPASGRSSSQLSQPISPAWMDPPPIHPDRMDILHKWHERMMILWRDDEMGLP